MVTTEVYRNFCEIVAYTALKRPLLERKRMVEHTKDVPFNVVAQAK